MEAGLCKLLHKLFTQQPSIHPILAPCRVGLNLQLAMHQRMCSTSFRVFLCGYGMKVLAQDFYLNPSSVCFFLGTGPGSRMIGSVTGRGSLCWLLEREGSETPALSLNCTLSSG